MTLKELYNELNELQWDITEYVKPVRCANCVNSRYIPEVGQFRCELLQNDQNERKVVDGSDYCSWGESGEEDEE